MAEPPFQQAGLLHLAGHLGVLAADARRRLGRAELLRNHGLRLSVRRWGDAAGVLGRNVTVPRPQAKRWSSRHAPERSAPHDRPGLRFLATFGASLSRGMHMVFALDPGGCGFPAR
ncbi:hypothetical protein GCM10010199_09110 [Dactylosporangium roseum]